MAVLNHTEPAFLTAGQVAAYREHGYLFPVRILDIADSRGYRGRLESYEAELGHPVQGPLRTKPHLLFRWVDELMRNNAILDCVEDLIGPDILCWNMNPAQS